MSYYFSENEVYSLDEIATEFNLNSDDPLLYSIYLHKNPDLSQDERDDIKSHVDKLVKKITKINSINLRYMERHTQKQN